MGLVRMSKTKNCMQNACRAKSGLFGGKFFPCKDFSQGLAEIISTADDGFVGLRYMFR